EFKDDD
ncbi:hypothetical protein CFC21_042322, partial [Triticum aestivum]